MDIHKWGLLKMGFAKTHGPHGFNTKMLYFWMIFGVFLETSKGIDATVHTLW